MTPFKLEKLGRILEALTKARTGLLSPRIMFEIRANYFLIGFYDKINLNGRATYFSFLLGKTHFNSFGLVLTNGTQIPVNLGKPSIKLYLISKATFLHKFEDKYTGWVDIGLSLRYDINTSKITQSRGLIKRRQTIIN